MAETKLAPKGTAWFLSTLAFTVPPHERTVLAVGDPFMALSLQDTRLKNRFNYHKQNNPDLLRGWGGVREQGREQHREGLGSQCRSLGH